MPRSDEFFPELTTVEAVLAAALQPTIVALSTELGTDSTSSWHVWAQGVAAAESADESTWKVRCIFRRTYSPARVLFRAHALLGVPHDSGFSGIRLKGSFDPASPSSARADSEVREYNVGSFSEW
jgi:hypothetical protein